MNMRPLCGFLKKKIKKIKNFWGRKAACWKGNTSRGGKTGLKEEESGEDEGA